jgi:hypothetical protein
MVRNLLNFFSVTFIDWFLTVTKASEGECTIVQYTHYYARVSYRLARTYGGVLALVGTVITNLQLLAFVSPFFALKSSTTPLPLGPQSK